MGTQSIPWLVSRLSKTLVLITFAKLRSRRKAVLFSPRVVMASEKRGFRPYHLMMIPNTKRHLNNMNTDQLL